MDTKIVKKSINQNDLLIDFFAGDLEDGITITCFMYNPHQNSTGYTEVSISVDEFKQYAIDNGLLNWSYNWNDPSQPNGHGQTAGTITWNEYCQQSEKALYYDLANFITNKNLLPL